MSLRLAILAIYDKDGIVDDYLLYLLKELQLTTEHIVVVCNGLLCEESRKEINSFTNDIFIRPNQGYDISAYKEVLEKFYGWDKVKRFDELLLINDSFYGPFCPMEDIFKEMTTRDIDFWGLTEQVPMENTFGTSYSGKSLPYHIQSYFIVVKKRLLHSNVFHDFWINLPAINNFTDAVTKFELVFTEYFVNQGYFYDTYVNCKQFYDSKIENNYNYLLHNPYELIVRYKCPIIKRKYFTQEYYENFDFSLGEDTKRVLEYIKSKTPYNETMIWKHLIRLMDSTSFHYAFQLKYILSEDIKEFNHIVMKEKKVAVIAHIYYEDLVEYCFEYLRQIPKEIDIYITTKSEKTIEKIKKEIQKNRFSNCQIIVIGDRGREIRGMLIECKEIFKNYEYVCFVHDKKTSGQVEVEKIGQSYMYMLWDNMLKSSTYIENILGLFQEEELLGILTPPEPYHWKYFGYIGDEWTCCYERTKALAKQLKLNCIFSENISPVALTTTFWCKTEALRPLFEHDFKEEDFPEEPMALDGTFNHAIERIFQYVSQSQGYATGTIMNSEFASLQISNYHTMMTGMLQWMYGRRILSSYKEYMIFDRRMLKEFIKGKNFIWIYGTGHYATIITKYMLEENIDFAGYIVSDGQEKKNEFYGKKIYWLSEIQSNSNDTGIILALDKKHQQEVFSNVKGKFESIFEMKKGIM